MPAKSSESFVSVCVGVEKDKINCIKEHES
jgi:hypothetical protein